MREMLASKTTGLVFVDLSKAFDRVQHQTLINELADIGLKDKGSSMVHQLSY